MKKTYIELGQNSAYKYENTDIGTIKKMSISNTLSSLNVVSGDNNHIKDMIRSVNNIGSEVKVLEASCFCGCQNLQYVNLPTTIEEIGESSFKDCVLLTSFKGGVLQVAGTVGSESFSNCGFNTLNISSLDNSQIIVGNGVFKDNCSLTDVRMNNILLGSGMFNGCENLSSISFDSNARVVYQSNDSFKGTQNLTSITLPESIDSYNSLVDNFLRNSSIRVIHANGLDSHQADIAVGGSSYTNARYSDTQSTSDIKLGTIYSFEIQETSKGKYNAGQVQAQVSKLFYNAIQGHIPIIQIQCNNECGYCISFKRNVLRSKSFIEWFQTQKCIIVYMQDLWIWDNSKKGHAIHCQPTKGWDNFDYTDSRNRTNNYRLYRPGIRSSGYMCIYGDFEEPSEGKPSKQILNTSNTEYTRIVSEDMNEIKLQRWVPTEEGYSKSDLTQPYSMLYELPIYTSTGYYPAFGFFWKRKDDVSISHQHVPFSKEQKYAFLTGNNFSIKYYSAIGNVEYEFKSTVPTTGDYREAYFSINGKMVVYYVQLKVENEYLQIGSIYGSFQIVVESDKLYFRGKIDRDFENVTFSADNFKQTVSQIIENIFDGGGDGKQNESPIITEEEYGNCWGIGHVCTVYDKDGTPHVYIPS